MSCQSLKRLRLVTGRPKVNVFGGDAGDFTKGILRDVDLSTGITGSRRPRPGWGLVAGLQQPRRKGIWKRVKRARLERSDVQ